MEWHSSAAVRTASLPTHVLAFHVGSVTVINLPVQGWECGNQESVFSFRHLGLWEWLSGKHLPLLAESF